MAGDAGGGGGMEKADLKKHLILARRQNIHVGLANDSGKIILIMDKIKKGRALVSQLEDAKPKPRDPRFGEVASDPENLIGDMPIPRGDHARRQPDLPSSGLCTRAAVATARGRHQCADRRGDPPAATDAGRADRARHGASP